MSGPKKESDKAVNWSALSVGGVFSEHSRAAQLAQQQEMQRQYLILQQQRLMEEQARAAELVATQQRLYEQRMAEQQAAMELAARQRAMEAERAKAAYEEALAKQRMEAQERQLAEQERALQLQRQQEMLRAQQLAIQQQRAEHEQRQRELQELERQAVLKAEAERMQAQIEEQKRQQERALEEQRREAAMKAEQLRIQQQMQEQAEMERLAALQAKLQADAIKRQQELEQAAVLAHRRAEEQKLALESARLESLRQEELHKQEVARRAELERQHALQVEEQRRQQEAERAEQERIRAERQQEAERKRLAREERERIALQNAQHINAPPSKQGSRADIIARRRMLIAQGLLDPNAPAELEEEPVFQPDSIMHKLTALDEASSPGFGAAPNLPGSPVVANIATPSSYLRQNSTAALPPAQIITTPLVGDGFPNPFAPTSPIPISNNNPNPNHNNNNQNNITNPFAVSEFEASSPQFSLQRPTQINLASPVPDAGASPNIFLAPEFLDFSKEDIPPRTSQPASEPQSFHHFEPVDRYPSFSAEQPVPEPEVQVLSTAKVFNSYTAEEASELTITEGEIIDVLHKYENGWWVGRNLSGAIGTFPSNFVTELTNPPPLTPKPEQSQNSPPGPSSPFAIPTTSSPFLTPSHASSSPSSQPHSMANRTDSSLEILFMNSAPKTSSSTGGSGQNSLEDVLRNMKFADQEQERRTKVTFEILESERSYVHGLQTLAQVFIDPLLASAKSSKPILKEREHKLLFPHLTVILSHNQIFLKELEERVAGIISDWTKPPRLGDLFLRLKDHLQAYNLYINCYPQVSSTLQHLSKSNTKFSQFLTQCKNNPVCHSWDLPTFLILPIQRVPRYILLLDELLKNTPSEHPDYEDLIAALVSLRDIAELINESKRDAESLPEVLRIYNCVEPKISNLVEPHRRFLMEGMIYEVKAKRLKQRYLFLFNDLLLVTDRKQKKDKKSTTGALAVSARLVTTIPLGSANIDPTNDLKGWKFPPEAQEMLPSAFILHATKSSYLFFAPTPQKKADWISNLEKSIHFAASRPRSSMSN